MTSFFYDFWMINFVILVFEFVYAIVRTAGEGWIRRGRP